MNHRSVFLGVLLALRASLQAAPAPLLVKPKDVGYGDYACLGNPIMRTPAVDAFRKQSLLFMKFHVRPSCATRRSPLMSRRHTGYDNWRNETLPLLANENVVGPKLNPLKELYGKQFGGGPDAKMPEKMNSVGKPDGAMPDEPILRKKRKAKTPQ